MADETAYLKGQVDLYYSWMTAANKRVLELEARERQTQMALRLAYRYISDHGDGIEADGVLEAISQLLDYRR